MTQTTILEKLKIIFEVSKSSKMFIAVIAFIILLAFVALTTNKKNVNRGRQLYSLIYATVIIVIIAFYHESLGKMYDYMMNNFFIVLYFPNVAVYLAAIIITNIILWISVFNLKTPKLVRTINVLVYSVIHYLLALVLNVITKNELDIFSQTSVYGNQNAQAIIEFSSTIFMLWIIFLILYKVIKKYLVKEEVPVKRKVIVKKVKVLPDSIAEVPNPLFVKGNIRKEEPKTLIDEPVIIAELNNEHLQEKQELERQLAEASEKLKLAEAQIKVQEETIKVKDNQRIKLEQEQFKLEEEQIKLQYEQTMLHQQAARLQQEKSVLQSETARLQQENKKLQDSKVEVAKVETTPKLDATAAIMNNLDNMFTLEDYKVLATILKDKQKKKNETKAREELRQQEQLKFAQLHEAYRSVR